MVFPIARLTKRWFDEETATLARLVTCVMPLYAWYATRLHQPALVMAFHPWLVAGWIALPERRSFLAAAGVGALNGVAGLFQPTLLAIGAWLSTMSI